MDQYGCNEVANIAIQCPLCNGLHINSDFIHVDIVDQEDRLLEAGKYGEILVTNLESRAFPLIKYRLGIRVNICWKNVLVDYLILYWN